MIGHALLSQTLTSFIPTTQFGVVDSNAGLTRGEAWCSTPRYGNVFKQFLSYFRQLPVG